MSSIRPGVPEFASDRARRPHRVAVAIARSVEARRVICSMADWSIVAGAAARTLRMWCCSAGVCTRDAIRFVRALTAIRAAAAGDGDPADLLDFAEARTRDRFLALSGPLMCGSQPVSVSEFCKRQRFIRHQRILSDVQCLVEGRIDRLVRSS